MVADAQIVLSMFVFFVKNRGLQCSYFLSKIKAYKCSSKVVLIKQNKLKKVCRFSCSSPSALSLDNPFPNVRARGVRPATADTRDVTIILAGDWLMRREWGITCQVAHGAWTCLYLPLSARVRSG